MTNSNLPPEHLTYLQQRPFAFGCSTEVFPFEELKALADYGNLLEALATGRIQPVTQEQLHFLVVDREEANLSCARTRKSRLFSQLVSAKVPCFE